MFSFNPNLTSARHKIELEVARRARQLVQMRVEGLRESPDGSIDAAGWNRGCQWLMDKIILPQLTEDEVQAVLQIGISRVASELIEKPVREEVRRLAASGELDDRVQPALADCHEHLAVRGGQVGRVPTKGLIVRSEPLHAILSGRKDWEMRSGPTDVRGPLGLVQKGSKAVFGVAEISDCLGPLTQAEMTQNAHRHGITPERLGLPEVTGYRFAWVLTNVRRLAEPVPYVHKGGVRFVTLDDLAIARISQQLKVSSRQV